MKKILSYLILVVYATIMIKPVMPSIADSFAHLLNYSDHIETVHQHDGASHVHYEYIEAAKKNSRGDTPINNTFKKLDTSSEHVMLTSPINFLELVCKSDYLKAPVRYLPVISPSENFHPPTPSIS